MTPDDIRESTKNSTQGIIAEGTYCDCSRCVMVRALVDVYEAAKDLADYGHDGCGGAYTESHHTLTQALACVEGQ